MNEHSESAENCMKMLCENIPLTNIYNINEENNVNVLEGNITVVNTESAKNNEEVLDKNIVTTNTYKESSKNCTKVENVFEFNVLEKNMKSLELNDGKMNENIIIQFKSEEKPTTVSSPRPVTTNRRYNLRPQKRPTNTDCEEYGVIPAKKNDTLLRRNGFLETIFEDPICKNGSLVFLGKSKVKRSISFYDFVTKAKIKHRKSKVKRLSTKKINKPKKVTVDDVKIKLKSLEESNNEDDWMDI